MIQELTQQGEKQALPKSYKTYLRIYEEFVQWCKTNNAPINGESVYAYCVNEIQNNEIAPTTMNSHLSMIVSVHNKNDQINKITKEQLDKCYQYLNSEIKDWDKTKAGSFSVDDINELFEKHFSLDREGTINALFTIISLSGFLRRTQVDGLKFENITIVNEGLSIICKELKRGRSTKPKTRIHLLFQRMKQTLKNVDLLFMKDIFNISKKMKFL